MNAKRLKQIEEIYHAALEIAPDGRDEFFKVRCGVDAELRREVESLLSIGNTFDSLIDTSPESLVADLFLEREEPTNLTGRKISHYEIKKLLGRGGMGEVYLAHDARLNRQVALKFLSVSLRDDKNRLRRFEREAFAASALNHPNILTIYEFGAENETPFIVTEYVEGKTLREALSRDELNLKEILNIAEQTAFALSAAHKAGIIHRDIKPENVMLREDGIVKVLDFGLAKLVNLKPSEQAGVSLSESKIGSKPPSLVKTNSSGVLGTVAYMSPEQARGQTVDARSDVWSLGVMVYEMLARKTPFAGETINEIIAAILTREAAPLDAGNAPPELQRIIRKALQKNADQRYQTIKDFLLDVKNLKRELEFAEELERSTVPRSMKATKNVAASGSIENATALLPAAVQTQKSLSQQTSSAEYVVSEIKKHKFASFVILAFVSLALVVGGYFFSNKRAATFDSIAVLPLVNASGDKETEFLSDGISETLINNFTRIPALRITARSTAFRYKGKEIEPQAVGRELDVDAILTGKVLQRGDSLSIQVDLINANDGSQIWGNSYNGKPAEILDLQQRIARDVSDNLKWKLSGAEQQQITKNYTQNAEAYQFYLKGRFYWNKRSDADLKKGIEYFREAVELDPNFALAWSGLADSYALLPLFSEKSTVATRAVIKMATEKALETDPHLAEAHNSRAVFLAIYEWDFVAADAEFRRAIELNPNYATARQWLSITLSWRLRHDEAVTEMQQALKAEPLSRIINNDLGYAFLYQKQNDKAIEQFKKTLELYPDFAHGHHSLALALARAGEYKEAIAEQNKAIALGGRSSAFLTQLSFINALSGNKGEAHRILEELLERNEKEPVGNYNLAIVYAGLDYKDKAFEYLAKLEQERFPRMLALKSSPYFENLHDDPRFEQLLKRLNLPE
jgi:eukaryotic-like serine/threonine-protein kinase